MSPTQRTLRELAARGYTAQVVERRIPFRHVTVDLFGGIDVLGVHPLHGILGVQATSDANHAARTAKLLREPRLYAWCRAGGKVSVWSWGRRCYTLKSGKRSKARRIVLREQDVTAAILEAGGYGERAA